MIERFDHQGAGIAYQNNKPIFVDGALPGEQVVVHITEQKSKFFRGQLIKIQQPSPNRIEAFCPHYQTCGGCNLQHVDHQQQIELKQQSLTQLMKKFAGEKLQLQAPIVSPSLAYRRRARISLKFDPKQAQLQFGFRQKNSQQIVNLDHCPVLVDELNVLLTPLQTTLAKFSQPKQLGHVELAFDGQHSAVLLRYTAQLTADEQQALIEFAQAQQVTMYWLTNSGQLQCLFGDKLQCIETGHVIPFLPTDFIQVNQSVNQKMVEQALEWLDLSSSDRVLDLFCGLGNFSFALAECVDTVVGVEGIAAMVDSAKCNAELNNIDNIEFYQADLEQLQWLNGQASMLWARQQFDKILLDPARAGASGVIDNIARLGAKAVVYVSCNPATLARDSQSLSQQGYQLQKLAMLDMFPHTSHLESMALFIKTAANKKVAKARTTQVPKKLTL